MSKGKSRSGRRPSLGVKKKGDLGRNHGKTKRRRSK
jgi:hypothetical protein